MTALIKEFLVFLIIGVFMLVFTIIGVWGFALMHVSYLKPSGAWQARREAVAAKDSLELEIENCKIEKDSAKVARLDSLVLRRSGYWRE
jgi:hypothetical protein